MLKSLAVLIPVYQPQNALFELVDQLQHQLQKTLIVVVDDGSTEGQHIFDLLEQKEVVVLHHTRNQGKGAALKTGFAYCLAQTKFPITGVITADADGQHLVEDICHMAQAFEERPSHLCLGVRSFEQKHVPLKSRLGNVFTRWVFRFFNHQPLQDTQTGLRAVPRALMEAMLHSKADRYEFELEMLIKASQIRIPIFERNIQTVYINENKGSHFNPLWDSLRIYFVFLRFGAVSLSSAFLDFVLFALLYSASGHMGLALWTGRFMSGLFNFSLNHRFSFKSREDLFKAFFHYLTLAVLLTSCSYGLLSLAREWGANVYLSKVAIESSLFFLSFWAQKRLVF